MSTTQLISPQMLLNHWQGHRKLTRRVIAGFPEKELFSFQIGGMRTFADMVKEMLSVSGEGTKAFFKKEQDELNERLDHLSTKESLLAEWDKYTLVLDELVPQLSMEQFHSTINLFNAYENSIINSILYFIDNEIHHRGQGYVYLRALGIEPPPFWER